MNASLRDYLLPLLGDLREPARLSEQGRAVRALLLAPSTDDAARIRALRDLLLRAESLAPDALRWLEVFLRGIAASGERPIEVEPLLLATLWGDLAARWPEQASLRAHQADELLLAGERDAALDLFVSAFEAQPALLLSQSGDVFAAFAEAGGEREERMRLARIRAFLGDGEWELAQEEAEELLAEHPGDAALQARVEAALGRPVTRQG